MTVLVTGGAGYIGSHMVLELADAGERVVVLDNLSTGLDWAVAQGVPLVVGDTGDQDAGRPPHPPARRRCDHSFRRLDRRSGLGARSARLLSQQHRQFARADRMRGEERRASFHFFLDRRGLRQSGGNSGQPRTPPTQPISPYGWSKLMTEIMLRDAGRAHGLGHVILRYFNVAGADPRGRTGQSSRRRRI